MLYHPPKFTYNGLTIIMSNPSRFDKNRLLDGVGGWFFNEECLRPETNRFCCDIRLVDDRRSLLPNTKCILLLGQKALTMFTGANTSLSEQRGSPLIVNNIPCIASFNPQDAVDPRDFESKFNAENISLNEDFNDSSEDEFLADKSTAGTSRTNYRFWLKGDTKKILKLLFEHNGVVPKSSFIPNYIIYPSSNEVIEVLFEVKNQDLYIDIETDFVSADLRCLAFNFGNSSNIYCVPILDTEYKPAYDCLGKIFKALAKAFQHNTVCAHNGYLFDFFILLYKYGISINKCFDTLLCNHRIFPKIEKSLGHCVSYWTWEPYHKNEGVHTYLTHSQAMQLYSYCAKDVYTMRLIKEAQLAYAKNKNGLLSSIEQVMRMIRPYLIATLTGIKYNNEKLQTWINQSDRYMMQYMRCMKVLHGNKVEMLISNKKCVEYFHNQLEYTAVKRTKTGNPSLAADALLKLRLSYDNPVIDFLLKYREKQKEIGTLQFKPYIYE